MTRVWKNGDRHVEHRFDISNCDAVFPAFVAVAKGFEQYSEAIFQNLSELQVLDRYERRISSRRDRAIRQIAKYSERKDTP